MDPNKAFKKSSDDPKTTLVIKCNDCNHIRRVTRYSWMLRTIMYTCVGCQMMHSNWRVLRGGLFVEEKEEDHPQP
jgi:hypothetical protein